MKDRQSIMKIVCGFILTLSSDCNVTTFTNLGGLTNDDGGFSVNGSYEHSSLAKAS